MPKFETIIAGDRYQVTVTERPGKDPVVEYVPIKVARRPRSSLTAEAGIIDGSLAGQGNGPPSDVSAVPNHLGNIAYLHAEFGYPLGEV